MLIIQAMPLETFNLKAWQGFISASYHGDQFRIDESIPGPLRTPFYCIDFVQIIRRIQMLHLLDMNKCV